jgi:hypothetical protein
MAGTATSPQLEVTYGQPPGVELHVLAMAARRRTQPVAVGHERAYQRHEDRREGREGNQQDEHDSIVGQIGL